jgi:hypothetical protein
MKKQDKMTVMDWVFGILAMFLLALMINMAVVNMTPQELYENLKYWIYN